MTGNVWEWTTTPWAHRHPAAAPGPRHDDQHVTEAACCAPRTTLGEHDRFVIKGGSHLCHPPTVTATARPPASHMALVTPPATSDSVASNQAETGARRARNHHCTALQLAIAASASGAIVLAGADRSPAGTAITTATTIRLEARGRQRPRRRH